MNKMDFYKFIKKQNDDYENCKYYKKCKECPCETLRNKIFGTRKLRQKCSSEMMALMFVLYEHGYNMTIFNAHLCKDCRAVSLIIAKALFREEKKKELNRI